MSDPLLTIPLLATPLTRKITQFSRLVLYAILALAAATFGVGLLWGQPAAETLTAAIALAVGMIPEGLPAALTVTLAIEMPPDTVSLNHIDVAEGLTFLGLQAIIDLARPEAVAAVRACQEAGIQIKMITGNHALTAAAIARQLGLNGAHASREDHEVMTGRDLANTSDGVNDGPTLKQADVGVAMGISGADVVKPFINRFLSSAPIGLGAWLRIVAWGSSATWLWNWKSGCAAGRARSELRGFEQSSR
jgi:magnesium-transporting ATPase (P-type)